MLAAGMNATSATHTRPSAPNNFLAGSAITRSADGISECHHYRFVDPDRIADRLGTGVHRSAAFFILSACTFRIVFPQWFAYLRPTASHRHPSRVSRWLPRIIPDEASYLRLQLPQKPP
jgi:hypothetical protein